MKKISLIFMAVMFFILGLKAQGTWQAYSDAILADKCTGGFVLGKDGGIWVQSGFSLTTADQIGIRDLNAANARAGGFMLAGVKYMFLRETEDGVLIFKKGSTGCAVWPLKTLVIVAVHGSNIQMPTCVGTITKVGSGLKSAGY